MSTTAQDRGLYPCVIHRVRGVEIRRQHPSAGLTGEVTELEGHAAVEVNEGVPVVPQLELRAERAWVHLVEGSMTTSTRTGIRA